jgi:poly-gamma-glutamate capsule biosynthesis protein CapA/YwtB (metallophosphatase superfamily)
VKYLFALLAVLWGSLHAETAVSIAFVGDVNFTGRIGEYMAISGTTWPFEKVKGALAKADYRVCNLESPAGVGGAKYCEKRVYFKANPNYLDALNDAGFNMVSLANNHALDYGPDILEQTRLELAKRNILDIGIVNSYRDRYVPTIVNIKGLRVAFLGYCNACPNEFGPRSNTAGVNVGMAASIKKQIGALKKNYSPDFIVAMPHWGTEYGDVDKNQEFTGRALRDAGVDLVVGAHPHVLQRASVYKNADGNSSVVAYSLGNFLFPMRWEVSMDSAILFVDLIKEGAKKTITQSWAPVSLDSNRPEFVQPGTERFKRDRYIIEHGYAFPEDRRWPKTGPWGK